MTLHTGETYVEQDVSIRPPDARTIRQAPHNNDVAASIDYWLQAAEHQEDVYYFAIYQDDTPVGQIVLHDMNWQARTSLVGYHLFQPHYRGQGIGTSALSLLLRFVEEQTDLTQLVIITSRDNPASQSIAQKCGFVYAGAPREDPIDGVLFVWNRPS